MTDTLFNNPNGWKFPLCDSQRTSIKGRLVIDMRIMVGDTELKDSHEMIETPECDIDYLRYKAGKLRDIINYDLL